MGPAATNPSPGIADFRGVRFEKPTLVRFYRVNKDSPQELRARFLNCEVEGIHFVDVNWHKQGDRMVLQDELDITEPLQPQEQAQQQADEKNTNPEAGYELVATAYRQLINNFENVRAYDLAEDCFCSAMEMKRLDPGQPWFSRLVVTLYRWASHYGSSYVRAALVVGILLVAFGLLFAIPWAGLHVKAVPHTISSSWVLETGRMVGRGMFHSFEIATFQRDTIYVTTTLFGRLLGILETVLVPSQLALLLLALRRRFRR